MGARVCCAAPAATLGADWIRALKDPPETNRQQFQSCSFSSCCSSALPLWCAVQPPALTQVRLKKSTTAEPTAALVSKNFSSPFLLPGSESAVIICLHQTFWLLRCGSTSPACFHFLSFHPLLPLWCPSSVPFMYCPSLLFAFPLSSFTLSSHFLSCLPVTF